MAEQDPADAETPLVDTTGKPVRGKAPKTERITIAPGRTVLHAGRHHGPGASVEMPVEDAAYLRDLGFVYEPPPPVTGPTINGEKTALVRA